MGSKKNKIVVILFLYHLIITVFSYQYALAHRGDSHFYWGETLDISKYAWLDFAHFGNDTILFINYPFLKLGTPFLVGFLLYSLVGFLGILKAMQWAERVTQNKLEFKGVNLIYLVFFLPNLHFWTSTLGKEPLVFFGIASVFYALASHKFKTVSFMLGVLLLVLIRPHVAMMLFVTVMIVYLFQNKWSLSKKIKIGLAALALMGLLFYSTLQLAKIYYFNWSRIQYYNEFSIRSFKHSGSYVPMLDYNVPHKIEAFLFQPLFFDAHSLLSMLASFENLIVLIIHLVAVYFIAKRFTKIKWQDWMKIALLFTIISSLLYIQRYANLGIFMRTKIQFMPFELIALLYSVKQGLGQPNATN
jgi:hypothetical protein